jgi:hypothetical protein
LDDEADLQGDETRISDPKDVSKKTLDFSFFTLGGKNGILLKSI